MSSTQAPPNSLTNNAKISLYFEGTTFCGWLASANLTSTKLHVSEIPRTYTPRPNRQGGLKHEGSQRELRVPVPDAFERCVFHIRAVDKWQSGGAQLHPTDNTPGTHVSYGQLVQLSHAYTQTWLCIHRRCGAYCYPPTPSSGKDSFFPPQDADCVYVMHEPCSTLSLTCVDVARCQEWSLHCFLPEKCLT